jgi:hypothetical protein
MVARIEASQLSERDQELIQLVAKFKQMTRGQIRDSLFRDLASATPADRTLKRLLEQGYLSRLRRLVGGDRGGSGQYVYQLGRAGWRLLDKPGEYWAPRAINLHSLAVADCYVTLKQAERDASFEVLAFVTEPACHRGVGDVLLTPDAYVEVGHHAERVKRAFFLEADRATEHTDKIQEKCSRYWRAYQLWQGEYFPSVAFVVPDERRGREIGRVVASGPPQARALFRWVEVSSLAATIIS